MTDDTRPKQHRCKATNKDGTPCGARAIRDGWCPWHDPQREEANREASRMGGKAKSNIARARKQLRGDIRDIADVQARLVAAMDRVEKGDMEAGPANAMANLARAIVTVAGVADFEIQLAEMRREIAELNERRSAS